MRIINIVMLMALWIFWLMPASANMLGLESGSISRLTYAFVSSFVVGLFIQHITRNKDM